MDTKKHYKLYKDGKKWCVMTIAAVASVIGLATTANADETNTTTSPVQTTQVADNSNVTETTESNANSNGLNQTVNNSNDTVVNNTENTTQLETTTSDNNEVPVMPQAEQVKNGWVNENNTWTYYNNGQVNTGRDYAYLPNKYQSPH